MKLIVTFIVSLIVFNVSADVSNYEEEDAEFEDMINNEFYENLSGYINKDSNVMNQEEQPIFSNGMWKCGDCSNVDQLNLLHNEYLELGTNFKDDGYVQTQIGFSLDSMKCILIKTDERNIIRCVSGSCKGDDVTLSTISAFNADIRIYGQ